MPVLIILFIISIGEKFALLLGIGLQPKNTVLTEREILLTTASNKRSNDDDGEDGNENINEQLIAPSLKIN